MKRLPLVLLALAVVSAVSAGAIWMVSDAHGHGLAGPDRTAIILLGGGAVACLVGALVALTRQKR